MPKTFVQLTSKRKHSASILESSGSEKEMDNNEDLGNRKTELAENDEKKVSPTEVKKEQSLLGSAMIKKIKGGGFGCKACNKKFSHRYKVRQHFKLHHLPREIFNCEHCDKTFKTKYQFNVHSNLHRENVNDYLFCCDKCDYRARSKHYLKVHEIRKHTTEYNFECDHCGKRFKMKMDLKFHLGTHGASQHMCDACGRMYTSQDSLYKHRRVVHINDYKYQCEICHQKLLTQENLDSHMASHKNLHSCDECDLKFTKKYYVTRHKKRVHRVEKSNQCPVCGKSFVCMATLRVHYLTHAKVKPYMCNVCGFSFTQRSSMMLHWKRKHPDAEEPPPPVILTNFFDAIQSEVHKLVETTNEISSTSQQPSTTAV